MHFCSSIHVHDEQIFFSMSPLLVCIEILYILNNSMNISGIFLLHVNIEQNCLVSMPINIWFLKVCLKLYTNFVIVDLNLNLILLAYVRCFYRKQFRIGIVNHLSTGRFRVINRCHHVLLKFLKLRFHLCKVSVCVEVTIFNYTCIFNQNCLSSLLMNSIPFSTNNFWILEYM